MYLTSGRLCEIHYGMNSAIHMPYNDGQVRTEWKWTILANFAAQALGYNSLKEHQIEVVLAVAGGRDVFAVLPTSYGKSVC